MNRKTVYIAAAAALCVTIASLVTWRVTGGDYYTKFEFIERIESPVDPDDPLAGTGFYDESSREETIVTRGLRFGLLPTPNHLFDKHLLSVVSVCIPAWSVVVVLLILSRRRNRAAPRRAPH